jgi:hypothetical protein
MLAFSTIFVTALIAFASPALALPVVPIAAGVLTFISYRQARALYARAYAIDASYARGTLVQSYCNGLLASIAALGLGAVMHITMLTS